MASEFRDARAHPPAAMKRVRTLEHTVLHAVVDAMDDADLTDLEAATKRRRRHLAAAWMVARTESVVRAMRRVLQWPADAPLSVCFRNRYEHGDDCLQAFYVRPRAASAPRNVCRILVRRKGKAAGGWTHWALHVQCQRHRTFAAGCWTPYTSRSTTSMCKAIRADTQALDALFDAEYPRTRANLEEMQRAQRAATGT